MLAYVWRSTRDAGTGAAWPNWTHLEIWLPTTLILRLWTPAADEGCHRRRAVEVERAWLRTCQERSVLGCVRLADTGGLAVVQ
jgi:hypothetical protein